MKSEENIRIRILRDVYSTEGGEAARARNARFAVEHPKGPLSEKTLSARFSRWKNGYDLNDDRPMHELKDRARRTEALQAAAQRLSGAQRIPDSKARLYRLPDGRIVKLTTNSARSLMDHDKNLFKHRFDALLIAVPVTRDTLSEGVEAYVVPVEVAEEAFRTSTAEWLASNPRTSGTNVTPVLHFDNPTSVRIASSKNFATTWAQYRLAGTDFAARDEQGSAAHKADARSLGAPVIRRINFPRYRGLFDEELLSAKTAEGFVTLMRHNTRSHWTPTSSNAEYMRVIGDRMGDFFGEGRKIRTDSAEHFVEDLSDAKEIEWLKRELVLQED
jgi:hypothetical protein